MEAQLLRRFCIDESRPNRVSVAVRACAHRGLTHLGFKSLAREPLTDYAKRLIGPHSFYRMGAQQA